MSDDNSGEEERQGDLIEAFKVLSGREGLLPQQFCKLYRKASGNLKNNYFITRVVSLWNKLNKMPSVRI